MRWLRACLKVFSRAVVPMWLLAVALPSLQAAGGDRLQQSELKQQQIQRTTQRVGDQLSSIIDEFERNGIAGDDFRDCMLAFLFLRYLSIITR